MKVSLNSILMKSLTSLFYPQVVLLFLVSFLFSCIFVGLVIWLSWDLWSGLFQNGLSALQPYWISLLQSLPEMIRPFFQVMSIVSSWVLILVFFALSLPLIVVLNLIIVSILASTYLVRFIAKRDYRNLVAMGRQRFLQGLRNTLTASFLFMLAWAITLPLWLIPGVPLILPALLTAWLNRRICTFDALTDFATDVELRTQVKSTQKLGFILGLITAFVNYIPLAFLFSPVVTMISYIHLGLSSLELQRQSNHSNSGQL